MVRWTSCYVDKRAISNKGQIGLYKCEKCGKLFNAKMCAKKRAKHIYCSTKCKKDAQVKTDRPQIDNSVYKTIYNKYFNKVRRVAFILCDNTLDRQELEDMMQYGFLELWYIYNRNKFDCSEEYVDKSLRHSITSNYKWFWKRREDNLFHYEGLEDIDRWNILEQKIEYEN